MADIINITEISPECLASDAGKVIHAVEINGGAIGLDNLHDILTGKPYLIAENKVSTRISSLVNSGHLKKSSMSVRRTNKSYTPKLNKPLDECYEGQKEAEEEAFIIDVAISKEEAEHALNESHLKGLPIKLHLSIE